MKFPVDLTQSRLLALADANYLSQRSLPDAPDGKYGFEVSTGTGQTASSATPSQMHSPLYNFVSNVQTAVAGGLPVPLNNPEKVASAGLDALLHKDAIDDRKDLFTGVLHAISKVREGTPLETKLNNDAITVLYNTLPHPPATYLGPETQFRSADGGGNNIWNPRMGKAGERYARSVQGKTCAPRTALPDPGLVFDELLRARDGDFQPHPASNSSLTFAFASLVTHSLFRTDPTDSTRNNTSSYLDLSPLYGVNQVEQDTVRDNVPRTMGDGKQGSNEGRGLLYPDCFAEERLSFLPPATSALLVVFCRNHNYIANMLLSINERRTWSDPPPADAKARKKQDEEIFQTARLINCGHFMALIFGDYVAGFLGLGREGNAWSMKAFNPIMQDNQIPLPRGEGNAVSVEFNILYRWHATTAQKDIAWTENAFKYWFKGKTPDEITLKDVSVAFRDAFSSAPAEPRNRTFGGLTRDPVTGMFADDDLARILHDATEAVAGAYRARGTPACLRVIEMMAIVQSRQWGVCTMNEFREFLGLKRFATFEEWNSKTPGVAAAARKLYGHIDNLELYAGLQAEDCMDLGPGSGICCGYTMTRAILGDAIALVRGDRYYTTDYTPANLTSWGFQDCERDPNNGAYGAALPKLLMRHLPRHYPANSAYSLFPFCIPNTSKANLKKLNVDTKYTFTRPVATPVPVSLKTLKGINYVFGSNNYMKYHQTYSQDMELLTRGYGFFLSFDDKTKHDTDKAMGIRALFPDAKTVQGYTDWYVWITKKLIKEKSLRYRGQKGNYIDIVGDVINLAGTHWSADKLCGISLKTVDNPKGMFTEQEAYQMFQVLFMCVFENVQPEHGWALRSAASGIAQIVTSIIDQNITEVSPWTASNPLQGLIGFFASVKDSITSLVSTSKYDASKECLPFLSALAASGKGRSIRDLTSTVMGFAVGSSVNFSQALAHIVDLYLTREYSEAFEDLKVCCRNWDKPGSQDRIKGYVREGMRLRPQFAGLLRSVVAESDIIDEGGEKVRVKKGDLIWASYVDALKNPDDFPNPLTIDPTRPIANYRLAGSGFHVCPGLNFAEEAFAAMLRVIFTLPNLRRAEGVEGTLQDFYIDQFGTPNRMFMTETGGWSPWPTKLVLVYDDE